MSIFNKRTPAPYNGGTIPPERISAMIREQNEREQTAQRLAALEKEQERQAREQERQKIAQERLEKEQARQAVQLEKHEREIAELQFRMSEAERSIERYTERIAQLDAQRDYALLQQAALIPGSKQFESLQKKIVTLDNQIFAAEKTLNRAKFVKEQAERRLA